MPDYPFNNEATQKEKREVLAEERRMRNTYLSHAGDVELELGGRFAKLTPTTVVGSEPVTKYPKLESGPWAKDECPPEPVLGVDINAIEAVGEVHERGEPVAATPTEPAEPIAAAKPIAAKPMLRRRV